MIELTKLGQELFIHYYVSNPYQKQEVTQEVDNLVFSSYRIGNLSSYMTFWQAEHKEHVMEGRYFQFQT